MGAFSMAWSLLKTIDADEEWYSYGGGKGSHYNAEDDVDYFASSPCPSCGGTEGFADDPEDGVYHWCGHSADRESICGDCHSPITARNPSIDAIKTPENAPHIKALMEAKQVNTRGPAGCFNCLEQHRLTGKLPYTPIQEMMGYEYNRDVHWRAEDLKDNDSELFRASSDVFEGAWSLLKAPIDVYSDRGRVREIEDDEMLYSGGDIRDDPRYYADDLDIALHYALFGSAVPYSDVNGRRETKGASIPPMRRTVPSISIIDPSDYPEDERGIMQEDPFSPGIGVMDDENSGNTLSHDKVIELLQEYIDEGRYKGVMGGTTGELFTGEQREKHAKDALSRLIAYNKDESLERWSPKPPSYEMDGDIFRTAEYDDFIETLGYDDSMADMLGDWNDLEGWQREAAIEAGYSEDDWV
jgi:hypothetical protein